MMDSLRRVAAELSLPERTLRRAAAEGLLRGERVSARRFQISLREESYLRSHWPLLSGLRAALRTEPNVRLAVLFGSNATGEDEGSSDVDLLVVLRDPDVGRMAELAGRLSPAVGRDVQLVRLSGAEDAPALMLDVLQQGRVLVDREHRWPGLAADARRWRRLARRAERQLPTALDVPDLDAWSA